MMMICINVKGVQQIEKVVGVARLHHVQKVTKLNTEGMKLLKPKIKPLNKGCF